MQTPNKVSLQREKAFLDNQNPHLRDIRLAIEFKHLVGHAPGGIYMFPHQSDIRQLFGVAFLRKGLYKGGIFRFKITLPKDYNSKGSYPHVVFTPPIFHPLVDPATGVLRLQCSEQFADWDPSKHFLISVLVFLKKIFYMKSFDVMNDVPNEEAMQLFSAARETFASRAQECVTDSAANLNRMPAGCPLVFTEPKPAHKALRDQIFGASAAQREAKRRSVAIAPHIGFLSPETPAVRSSGDTIGTGPVVDVVDCSDESSDRQSSRQVTQGHDLSSAFSRE